MNGVAYADIDLELLKAMWPADTWAFKVSIVLLSRIGKHCIVFTHYNIMMSCSCTVHVHDIHNVYL